MLSALDISTSGLVAQRARMNVISSNLANLSTTRNELGEPEPYERRFAVFQTDDNIGSNGGAGVMVRSINTDQSEPFWRYEPDHPDALKDGPRKGYVAYPNVQMMTEFTDALEAARSYEANLGAMEISKDLEHQTLRILA